MRSLFAPSLISSSAVVATCCCDIGCWPNVDISQESSAQLRIILSYFFLSVSRYSLGPFQAYHTARHQAAAHPRCVSCFEGRNSASPPICYRGRFAPSAQLLSSAEHVQLRAASLYYRTESGGRGSGASRLSGGKSATALGDGGRIRPGGGVRTRPSGEDSASMLSAGCILQNAHSRKHTASRSLQHY